MSIETLINTTTLPSMALGAENPVQTPGAISEAFTSTLQAQVQRLNVTPTITSAPITPASVNASVTIPTVEINTAAPTATVDSASVSLQATATANLSAILPNLLDNPLSVPVDSQNAPLVVKKSGDTKPVSTTPPTVDALPRPAFDVQAPVNDRLPIERQISATTSAVAAPLTVVLPQAVDGQLASPAAPVQKLSVTQMAASALTAKKEAPADTIQDQLTALLNSTVAEAGTQQTDGVQVVFDPPLPIKKMDKMRAVEEVAQLPVGQILPETAGLQVVPTTEVNFDVQEELTSPLEAVLTPAPEAANTIAAAQEVAVNSLLQAGVLQPVMAGAAKTPTQKTEPLMTTLPKTSSVLASPPNTTASGVIDGIPASNAASGLAAVSDIAEPKTTFTAVLDHLKPHDASVALDAGLAKTLANLSAELAVFDRPVNNPVKAEIAPMAAHLYSPHFNEELGTKIVWMTTQNMSSAELTLNPEHLGPIAIQINMQQDQASVAFTAQNAGVKEMLEASIPKLRDMLQTQNLNLADVNVSQQSFSGQNQGQASHNEGQKRAFASVDHAVDGRTPINETAEHIEQSRTLVSNGLVSLYA